MRSKRNQPLPANITRRDFVNCSLVGSGYALLSATAPASLASQAIADSRTPGTEWYGYGGVGDYRSSHGNTPAAVAAAHDIRDGRYASLPDDLEAEERYDLVIVGAGMAGLGAALEYRKRRRDKQRCLVLDNHPIFGGESKENEFEVDGTTLIAPQGANGFSVPPAVDDWQSASGDARYYAELDIPRELPYQDWESELDPLELCRDNYGYLVRGLQDRTRTGHYFGAGGESGRWVVDMWRDDLARTPLPEQARRNLLSWYGQGRSRSFASDEEARRFLDSMSYQQYLESELGLSPHAARYADLFLAAATGLGSDAVSAYAASLLPMPGLNEPPGRGYERHSFPGGNSGFARYFLKALIPDAIHGGRNFDDVVTGRIDMRALDRSGQPLRMRMNSTVVSVRHGKDGRVRVVYARGGKLHAIDAGAAVMATGGWINRHVVRDMPEEHRGAYEQFHHAPFLVANVALTNWQFIHRLGMTAAIWDREDAVFGSTCNLRRPMRVGRHRPALDPGRPAVLSFYTPFHAPGLPLEAQISLGRAELLRTSYADYERRIVAQMQRLFQDGGFDAQRDIAGIILNRWGHAYSVPYPGFYGGSGDAPAPRNVIRRHYGRIAFAHSELDGLQHWGPAADEGRRAFGQVADAL